MSPAFAPRCLSLDLEVGIKDGRIYRFAAVRGDNDERLIYAGGDLQAALRQLDELAQGVSFLLGHNIEAFDRRHLAAAQPDLRLLQLPIVDTLRINPLAYPRNPYHRHTQIGRLQAGSTLRLHCTDAGWMLLNTRGHIVGHMAKSFQPPPAMHCCGAKVEAIIVRYRTDSQPEYQQLARSERWETVLPRLVFEPDTALPVPQRSP